MVHIDFLSKDDGAIAVDWVVLTAAVLVLGLAVVTIVEPGVSNVAADISTDMASQLGDAYAD